MKVTKTTCLLATLLSCAPARHVASTESARRAVLAVSKCRGNPMGRYLADRLAADPVAAAADFRAAMAEGQALRWDVTCSLHSLGGDVGSCPNGGCRDVRGLAAWLLEDAGRRGLLQLPVR